MRRIPFVLAISLSSIPLLGCPMPPTNAAEMQQTASDFNTDVRFGRTELAVEKVIPEDREEFLKHRKQWGKAITLADYELVSAKMEGDSNADVCIKYSWYRVTDSDLHETTIKQRWRKHHGNWRLATEAKSDGDDGIFDEGGVPKRTASDVESPRSVQFPTVRFGD